MKKSGNKSVLITLVTLLTILSSCQENVTPLVKIPDFATLSSQFLSPPAEYTTAPFFVWNAEITETEIDNYLTSFKNSGSLQVIIHPRPGLITEYLSEEWFSLFRYTVNKGKELGMKVWIYDENSYPSGFAGGHVPDQMPESYNQGQGLIMTKFESLPDSAGKYFLCLKDENGIYSDITSLIDQEIGRKGNYLLFSKTYYEKSDWFGGKSYVDLLYPGVTQKFIEITMSGYEAILGDEFGKTVPGTFTDEPEITSPGGIRWTPDLFEVFQAQWNYDLRTNLPCLFEETGDWKRIRHNYTQTLLQMFIDRWAKPWYSYCEEKGLNFTGHYWEHEWPNMRPGGDNMAMYAWHQVPAVDMLFNQWDDSSPKAQFGNVRSIKELASAANQTGAERKLSETYGGAGWEITFAEMKRNGDWEYALGVNMMNQHLSHFTLAGARKYDYPPTFSYHEPWWQDYKYLNDHYARLSLALSSGRQVNDILILEPTTTSWLYDSYVKPVEKCNEIGQSFQTFITMLEKEQVEYDLGSENIIKDMGNVSKGRFIVGNASYSKVVIPPMTENLDMATFNLLRKFVSAKGTIIAFSKPTLVNGSPNEDLKKLFEKRSERIVIIEKLTTEIVSKNFKNARLSFNDIKGGDLFHHRRILSNGQLIFLVNSSLKESVEGTLSAEGKGAIEMNTLSGEIKGYPFIQTDKNITLTYVIPPAGSLMLYIPAEKRDDYPAPGEIDHYSLVSQTSPLKVARINDNVLMIDFCDLKLGKELSRDIHVYDAADKIFKYHGFKNGNPWNTSVQFKNNTVSRDTFRTGTGFTATYNFDIKGKFDYTTIKAVVERPGLWTVSVNGIIIKPEDGQWWLDRSFGVFSIGSLVKPGRNTIVLRTDPMKIHAEIEPVYLTGNFSVIPALKGWTIEPPLSAFNTGSWKSQGMPFYSWGISYSEEYDIENTDGNWLVSLGRWNGTVAEVYVNGQPAPKIAIAPYRSDISSLIKPGTNLIEVRVIGSLKNLLGPHHNNPKPGMVSPWIWRNVKNHPSGNNYQMLDYGLFENFTLLNGK